MPPLAPPDGPTLTGANLKSGIVAELIQLADRLGVDSRLWFEGMRLDNTRFDDEPPVYLSYRQACQIIRRALERGSRSGRVAYQFATDYAGRHPR